MGNFIIENGKLTKYTGSDSEVWIPDSVTEIGYNAFNNRSTLTEIHIPNSVKIIGKSAFRECRSLKTVHIPNSVVCIDRRAFYDCTALTEIHIPDGVEEIGKYAFFGCHSLKTVRIPDGVEKIGEDTFYECHSLKTVYIPDSVTQIGSYAFAYCRSLTEIRLPNKLKTISNDMLYSCPRLKSVRIPDGVVSIGWGAFSHCTALTEIHIPNSVEKIGYSAFYGCLTLKVIRIPDSIVHIYSGAFADCKALTDIIFENPAFKLDGKAFGDSIPENFNLGGCQKNLTDGALRDILTRSSAWNNLSIEQKTEIFLTRQGKPLLQAYQNVINKEEAELLGNEILTQLKGKPSVKVCNTAATFMTMFLKKISAQLLQNLYNQLKKLKTAAKAVKTIEEDTALMALLGGEIKVDANLHPAMQMLTNIMAEQKRAINVIKDDLKKLYAITFDALPEFRYKDGEKGDPAVLAWLLTAHEKLQEHQWGQPDVVAAYEKPGICEDAAKMVAELDQDDFKKALMTLADTYLGAKGRSKKMFLAYPICRYADEEMMLELTKRAPKWRSVVSGNEAPPLLSFRNANAYSETRAAMMFADKYHVLDDYAKIRGTTADVIRDRFLSDVGIDKDGRKSYDLGNQTVVAELQKDLSFLVRLPDGKTAKSIPKKGADPEKYDTANADFSEMKKSVKKIVKNRSNVLFEDFLSGRERPADEWMQAYLNNPLLKMVASLLVWQQGKSTFTLTDNGAIKADGSGYNIADNEAITVAHPMEMDADDVTAWQKYFTAHTLKQPFEQIWEPVIPADQIKPDRYVGCAIPYYRFTGQEKRGIHVDAPAYRDYNGYYNDIEFKFDVWDAEVKYIDKNIPNYEMYECFEIKSFSYKTYNRHINHLVAYFDRATVWDRIRRDDVDVINILPRFTLAQICEFIKVANESGSVNVTALLLEYKNKNFADFDPMAEFSLDW